MSRWNDISLVCCTPSGTPELHVQQFVSLPGQMDPSGRERLTTRLNVARPKRWSTHLLPQVDRQSTTVSPGIPLVPLKARVESCSPWRVRWKRCKAYAIDNKYSQTTRQYPGSPAVDHRSTGPSHRLTLALSHHPCRISPSPRPVSHSHSHSHSHSPSPSHHLSSLPPPRFCLTPSPSPPQMHPCPKTLTSRVSKFLFSPSPSPSPLNIHPKHEMEGLLAFLAATPLPLPRPNANLRDLFLAEVCQVSYCH
jgi:hypothetical protein